jgi:hypothetical protein
MPARENELASLIFSGAAGTALAAAAFPPVQLLWLWLAGELFPPQTAGDVLECMIGWLFGTYLVATVAMVIACVLACYAWLLGIGGRRVWYASLVGGWTGFLITSRSLLGAQSEALVLVLAATWWGQGGAAWCAANVQRREASLNGATPGGESQFRLRQLFGMTTAVCLTAAILGMLSLTPRGYGLLLMGIGLQFVAIVVAMCAVRCLRRRDVSAVTDNVSRETAAPATRLPRLAKNEMAERQ